MSAMRRPEIPLRLRRNAVPWDRQWPTWREAKPALIAEALDRAGARPSGNWFVVGGSLTSATAGRSDGPWRARNWSCGATRKGRPTRARGPARTWGRR